MIVMVAAVVIAVMVSAMSENICFVDASGFDYLMYCSYLEFFESIPGNHFSAEFGFPLKYALVFCTACFGAGFLWYQGAIKVPIK
jgi:hypothetical protein